MAIPSSPPPKHEYLGKFVCNSTSYDVFGPKTDPRHDEALVKRTEESFKKTVAKKGGQLPDGRVRIELTKQEPSDKPTCVFIRKSELLPPHLAARVSAAAGNLNALESMWSKDDPVTKELYYKYKFEILEENSLHLFDSYLKTVPWQKERTWEDKYNAIIQAAIPDFMSGNPPQLREVLDVTLAAVNKDPLALKYASDNLKNDRDIVMEAVKEDTRALEFASDRLKNDEDFMMEAITKDPWALQYASNAIKNNKAIVLIAVSRVGEVLYWASNTLKNDEDIVMEAVKQNPHALDHASNALKNNKAIVLIAVSQAGEVLYWASATFKNDKDVVTAAVNNKPLALKYASDALKNDKDVVLTAIKNNKTAFKYASPTLQLDPEVRAAAGR